MEMPLNRRVPMGSFCDADRHQSHALGPSNNAEESFQRAERGTNAASSQSLAGSGIPRIVADSIREKLSPITDQGTTIDTGEGFEEVHFWMSVSGVEYYVSVRKSVKQRLSESAEEVEESKAA